MEKQHIKDACECEWVRSVHVYFSEFTCFFFFFLLPCTPCGQVGKKENDDKEGGVWGERGRGVLDGQGGGGDMTLAAK